MSNGTDVIEVHLGMSAALKAVGSTAAAAVFCRRLTCNQAAYQEVNCKCNMNLVYWSLQELCRIDACPQCSSAPF